MAIIIRTTNRKPIKTSMRENRRRRYLEFILLPNGGLFRKPQHIRMLDDVPDVRSWERLCPCCDGTGDRRKRQMGPDYHVTYTGPVCLTCDGTGRINRKHQTLDMDRHGSRWRIYPTQKARQQAALEFRRMGYNYINEWLDVAGYGLHAAITDR